MKSKIILSLVMAAAVTLGATAMSTNANYTAIAVSNGNAITMGTVQIGNDSGQVGQTINMNTLFNVKNLGTLTEPVTESRSIIVKGSLPVKLSMAAMTPTDTAVPTGVMSTWWRHYKSNVVVSVKRTNGTTDAYSSRPDTVTGGFDSMFDTIVGTAHTPAIDNTTGISALLTNLGTLHTGDVVTITTKNKFSQTAYYTKKADGTVIDGDYTLTQNEVNAFQGKSLYINLNIVATEAK